MPYPGLLHPELLALWQATADLYLCRRHSNTVLAQSLWGLWVLVHPRFLWALQGSLVGIVFDSKYDFAPPTIFLGFLLCPRTWGIFFFGGIQPSPVNSCSAWVVILAFLQEKMSTHPSTPPSSSTTYHVLLQIISGNGRLPLPENSSPKSIRASFTASYPYNTTVGFMPWYTVNTGP